MNNDNIEKQLQKKKARKATPGGFPKLINLPRNWLHQGLSYMDTGELYTRLLVESIEFILILYVLDHLTSLSILTLLLISFIIAHTWNWVTNGLFWAVIIFTFPWLRNPGAMETVSYLGSMKSRLEASTCIVGVSIYGSVTRGQWHNRSDIDIRYLRKEGFLNLLCAAIITMRERFIAFIYKQPLDLFLADDVDFLKKLRSDEVPVIMVSKDAMLSTMYPGYTARAVNVRDLLGHD